MARKLTSSRLNGAFALPMLAALSMSALGCASEPSEETTGESFDKLVYAVRQYEVVNGDQVNIDVAGGMGQVMDYGRYNPGGRLEVFNLKTGTTENILEGFDGADVSSLDVSFDATKVVFTMKQSGDDSYHVYWSSLARGTDGKFEIHQLTFGPQDDEHAVWVPGDKIAFITNQGYTDMGTRADEYNHSRVVTQIGTITLAGGDADRKLCSQNLSHTINLFPMADGRIGFSRWEHLENVNDVKLFAVNPDCTQMVAISGQHGKPSNSLVQVTETNTPNVFLAVATDRENTIQSGALVRIDARSEVDPARFDEERPDYDIITPAVPRGREPSPVGRYRTPHSLPDGRILTSWASGFVNDLNELSLTAPDFGVYVYDPETRVNKLIVNNEKSWELYAKPVVVRNEPAIISSIQDTVDSTIPTNFGSIDVRQTSLFDVHGNTVSGAQFDGTPLDEALGQAKKVRIIEGFSSEAAYGATMFGLTMAEGAAIVGEAKVYADGSWLAAIPPYIPVHLQPIDEYDLAIRNQTTWIQGMPGEDRVCGGCHESRTSPSLSAGQQLTMAAGNGPENFMKPVGERTEYPWANADVGNALAAQNEIQQIFNSSCTSCHNSTMNGSVAQTFYTVTMADALTGTETLYKIPRLDLTDAPITVTYDNMTQAWPASYVSLFYPAALEMEMGMGEMTIVGDLPPNWAVPSDARGSALIEKLNVTSFIDTAKYAWPLGQAFTAPKEGRTAIAGATRTDHATEVGLSRENLVKLIRTIDMGGQYYARQNTQFAPYAGDPVAPGGTKY